MDRVEKMQKAIEFVSKQVKIKFPDTIFFNKNFVHQPNTLEIFCVMCVDRNIYVDAVEYATILEITKIKLGYEKMCISDGVTEYPYLGFRVVKL